MIKHGVIQESYKDQLKALGRLHSCSVDISLVSMVQFKLNIKHGRIQETYKDQLKALGRLHSCSVDISLVSMVQFK